MWERAINQSADFVEKELGNSLFFENKLKMWNYSIQLVKDKYEKGICLEFGVAGGNSINLFSKQMPNFQFIGFDSFVGLKEEWFGHHATKGTYSQDGVLPTVNSNVKLLPGWFHETIPLFIKQNNLDDLCFIHIDGDTYEAAKTVFDELGSFLKPGTYILFDELIGYPNWQNGEYKALMESQKKFNFSFKFRAFTTNQALIELIS